MDDKASNPTGKLRAILPVTIMVAITIAGFSLRTAYINQTEINNPVRADARQYVIYAINLLQHKTFSVEYPSDNPTPDSFRSPGYPAFVAFALRAGGKNYYKFVLYSQVVLGTLMIPATYLLGISFLPLWGAQIAAGLVALSPHLVTSASYVLTETLFGTLLISALLLFSFAVRRSRSLLFAMSGVVFGMTYLVNEVALFLPFGMALALILITRSIDEKSRVQSIKKSPFLSGAFIFMVVFSLFVGSWMTRNLTSIPPGGKSGKERALITMAHGTYPGFMYKNPRYKYYPYRDDPEFEKFTSSYSSFAKILFERARKRPLRYLTWYLFEKPYYIWSWNIIQGQGDVYIYPVVKSLYQKSGLANASRILMKILHPVTMLLGLGGIFLLINGLIHRKHPDPGIILPLLIPILYFTFFYTIFASLPRYSVPLRPFLYLMAIWTLTDVSRMISSRKAVLTKEAASD